MGALGCGRGHNGECLHREGNPSTTQWTSRRHRRHTSRLHPNGVHLDATGTADWTTVAVVAVYCSTVSQMLVFLVVWVVWVVWVLWVAVAAWDHVWFPAVGI